MNKILLRFNIINNNEIFEVIFDTRLSFNDNFKLLGEIYHFKLKDDNYIFDLVKDIPLRKDVPLKSFNLPNFMTLSIF